MAKCLDQHNNSSAVMVWVWQDYVDIPDHCFERYQQHFSSSEKQRLEKISATSRRCEYIAGHYLLRAMLQSLFGPSLSNEAIEHLPDQPPRLLDSSLPVDFNISHSDGLVACVLSQKGEVGIDIESPRRSSDIDSIASGFFSKNEAAAIHALDSDEKTAEFYRLWTLKESVMKATKEGISRRAMKVEFLPVGDVEPPLGTYSYSFKYNDHYAAITLPFLLKGHLDIVEYESEFVLKGKQSLPLSSYIPVL